MEVESPVYVVDDDPAMSEIIARVVSEMGYQVETFATGRAFLSRFVPDRPGCLVLDVRLPGEDGLELYKDLARRGAAPPTVLITGHGDIPMAVEAMKAGALDFLEKPFRMLDLCESIQRGLQHSRELIERRRRRDEARQRLARLTPAEYEVLVLVAEGKTNRQIACELGLSVRAVEDRRARMTRRIGAASRSEITALVRAAQDTPG